MLKIIFFDLSKIKIPSGILFSKSNIFFLYSLLSTILTSVFLLVVSGLIPNTLSFLSKRKVNKPIINNKITIKHTFVILNVC